MFKRRKKIALGNKILDFIWPAIGWRRAITYNMHRLARLPDTAFAISGGFACGAAMSFTPFVGLHFVLSGILAWIIRANIIASVIGTAVGNPWTFPFIWTWLYKSGTWMTSGKQLDSMHTREFSKVFGHILEALLSLDVEYLMDTAGPVFWPMFVSGVPTAFVIWWAIYLPLKYIVRGHQKLRLHKFGGRATANGKE